MRFPRLNRIFFPPPRGGFPKGKGQLHLHILPLPHHRLIIALPSGIGIAKIIPLASPLERVAESPVRGFRSSPAPAPEDAGKNIFSAVTHILEHVPHIEATENIFLGVPLMKT
jgi:hypothetical protein